MWADEDGRRSQGMWLAGMYFQKYTPRSQICRAPFAQQCRDVRLHTAPEHCGRVCPRIDQEGSIAVFLTFCVHQVGKKSFCMT